MSKLIFIILFISIFPYNIFSNNFISREYQLFSFSLGSNMYMENKSSGDVLKLMYENTIESIPNFTSKSIKKISPSVKLEVCPFCYVKNPLTQFYLQLEYSFSDINFDVSYSNLKMALQYDIISYDFLEIYANIGLLSYYDILRLVPDDILILAVEEKKIYNKEFSFGGKIMLYEGVFVFVEYTKIVGKNNFCSKEYCNRLEAGIGFKIYIEELSDYLVE